MFRNTVIVTGMVLIFDFNDYYLPEKLFSRFMSQWLVPLFSRRYFSDLNNFFFFLLFFGKTYQSSFLMGSRIPSGKSIIHVHLISKTDRFCLSL